jgi:hypothetical protein
VAIGHPYKVESDLRQDVDVVGRVEFEEVTEEENSAGLAFDAAVRAILHFGHAQMSAARGALLRDGMSASTAMFTCR